MTEQINMVMKRPPISSYGKLISFQEACARLDCGRTKLYRLHNEGKVQLIKLGRYTKVTEESIDAFIKTLEPKPKAS